MQLSAPLATVSSIDAAISSAQALDAVSFEILKYFLKKSIFTHKMQKEEVWKAWESFPFLRLLQLKLRELMSTWVRNKRSISDSVTIAQTVPEAEMFEYRR